MTINVNDRAKVFKLHKCKCKNIVLVVDVKEDVENVNDSEILKLFIERL